MTDISFLKTFADAWNEHDLDAIMEHMAAEGVFISSRGSRFEGSEALRKAFAAVLKAYPDARFESGVHFVSGSRGVSEWMFRGTDVDDGTVVEQKGCDLFTFADGKILIKDSYLK